MDFGSWIFFMAGNWVDILNILIGFSAVLDLEFL
jgi:hypothetical protein